MEPVVFSRPAHVSASLVHLRSSNIEEHAAGMAGWSLQYNQLTPGKFSGQLTILELEGIQFVRDRANLALFKSGQARKDWLFTFPLRSPSADFYCAGHQINRHSLLVTPSASLPDLRAPEHIDLLAISVDAACFATLFEDADESARVTPQVFPFTDPDTLSRWQMLSDSLDEKSQHGATLLDFTAIRKGLRDTLLIFLSDMVGHSQALTLTGSAKKRIVDRAQEYMLTHCDNPPSILELCKHAGASRRKLQYCFQETLGINPVSYLRVLRLNGVHRELLRGASSVQDVAYSWGFWHLSRFANDYRQLFGEPPSATLAGGRNNSANFG
ncbi:helix-turn-helix domain-containing protein [Dickeya solani]|uniref:Helix-turn-helix domain-containing protein n=1 Tax=Dickeya solani TaxID=1089444 RepID=A0ABU4EEL1_9GAMM|nr:helix-turn-helix domain-containing protein [Dickeya solani]MCA7000743.1 helix-turn-helix domain-containing protein [Dickeya solani]MCZ0823161.1 helix-turn-helix domain-containing protein [Dickeya solani]MDV6997252.1 helix-turn-helix domain-containing protein [Dickeya solani]MDV7003669.1 helix-turn-helix domain-containing protein [Dickeya solani]MDV7036597.1 helix-turn-helix domain-containing protein [Dickeya solani]